MSSTLDAALAASSAPDRSWRYRSRMRATSIQAVAASSEARRVPSRHSASALADSPAASMRRAARRRRPDASDESAPAPSPDSSSSSASAGAPKRSEVDRHAVWVEDRRLAPGASPKSDDLRLEQGERDDVLQVVVEHLGQELGRAAAEVVEIAPGDVAPGDIGVAPHAEHPRFHLAEACAAKSTPPEPSGDRQEVVVESGQGGLLREKAVHGQAAREHRQVEGTAVVRDHPRCACELASHSSEESPFMRVVGEQVLPHDDPIPVQRCQPGQEDDCPGAGREARRLGIEVTGLRQASERQGDARR